MRSVFKIVAAKCYPRFIDGPRDVTLEEYRAVCARDPTLPPYRPEDDDPRRTPPARLPLVDIPTLDEILGELIPSLLTYDEEP